MINTTITVNTVTVEETNAIVIADPSVITTGLATVDIVLTIASTGFTIIEGGGGGSSDHGLLTGLADDDHTQYHTDARGDARYYTQSQSDTLLNAKFDDPTGDATQYLDGAGIPTTLPVAGQAGSLVRQVRNETGATLAKGAVIYLLGASGNKPLALKAIANSEAASDRTFGVIQSDISNNSNGYCVVSGDLAGLDTSALTEGAILYLSPTVAGGSTTTQPASPYHSVVLGVVTRSHATQGQVDVSIKNGFELSDIHDVSYTGITSDDFLKWNGSLWVNTQLAAVALSNDYGDLDNIPSTFAPSAHAHTLANVTDVTMTVANLNSLDDGVNSTLHFHDSDRSRTNHTGTQAVGTITGLGTLATQSGTFSGTSSGTNTGDQNLFSTIAVSGQSNVVADAVSDTLTLVAGTNVTITTNSATDTITINAAGGGGASIISGESIVSFGATATNEAQLVVTGQAGILAGSKVTASIGTNATSDYTSDDHKYMGAIGVHVTTGDVIVGTSFTIFVRTYQKLKGDISINWVY